MVLIEGALLGRLAKIENISRDEDNGPGRDLCPACFGDGQWNWTQGSVISVDPIEHEADCPLAEMRALLDGPKCSACNDTGKMHEPGQDPGSCAVCRTDPELHEQAAQPQGEPVLYLGDVLTAIHSIHGFPGVSGHQAVELTRLLNEALKK